MLRHAPAWVAGLQTRSYELPDGSKRTLTEVIGDRVWFLDGRRAEGDSEGQPGSADAHFPYGPRHEKRPGVCFLARRVRVNCRFRESPY